MDQDMRARLPRMDTLLSLPALADSGLPYSVCKAAAQQVLDELRLALRSGRIQDVPPADRVAEEARTRAEQLALPSLRPVVNATGVVLHTNLGRAPLGAAAVRSVCAVARGYSNLEYDLAGHTRGSRSSHVEELLCALTGAEAAFVVNNNAAAVFLMLSVLAAGQGVAISRGELVEIGGSFRVPDIMARSGARLVEVGTTNRTRPADYEAVLDRGEAQVLMKVHPSNFRVVGFTREATLAELSTLGRSRGVPVLCDLGSGALNGRGPWPADYPTAESAAALTDVACFSGDKLLGGPQAGILIGRKDLIDRLRRDPLARVLRIDKLSLAALEATLRAWTDPEGEAKKLPVPAMLAARPEELRARAEALAAQLAPICAGFCTVSAAESAGEVGGGALPGVSLPAWAVVLAPESGDTEALERSLRENEPPILGRIHRGALLLDVRTLLPGDEDKIVGALSRLSGERTR